MKTPKYFFNLESTKDKTSERLIFFNMSYGYSEFNPHTNKTHYIPFRISTKQTILEEYWDADNYEATGKYVKKYGKTLNDVLTKIEEISRKTYNSFYEENDRIPSPKELKELVLVKLKRKKKIIKDISLKHFISEKIKYFKKLPLTATNNVKDGTIKTYSNILNLINKYEDYKNDTLTFQNFDERKYWDFFDVINEIYKKENKKDDKVSYGYLTNSIAKISKTFLALLNMAAEEEIPMVLNLNKKGLRIQELKKSNDVYINEEQLLKILKADVSHSSEFTNAKNYLLISSLTGLRFEDMYSLNKSDVQTYKGKNKNFIGFKAKIRKASKVNKEVFICVPIFDHVKEILSNNGGKFPSFPKNQPMNRQLKKFCKHIGFNEEVECKYWYYKHEDVIIENTPMHELIETHTGRKTFYTNLTQLEVNRNIIENVTHPKYESKTMAGVYNNSTIIDNAEMLLNSLSKVKSSMYKYSD